MITISRDFVDKIRAATKPEDLHEMVQAAITLELATIPPYLCAWCTLKPFTNDVVAGIIYDIVFEEMLHMTIMCNLLIALGGSPRIAYPDTVPTYPCKLPMSVGNSVVVHLRKCSLTQIEKVFMEIEKPEKPINFRQLMAVQYATIGEFYRALVAKLEELGDTAFKKENFDKEVIVDRFGDDVNFRIVDVGTARRAILDVIVLQGEGTTVSPTDAKGQLAHYYQFQQIVVGKELVKDSSPKGWSFSGKELKIEADDVWNMDDDPKAANYPAGTASRAAADKFNTQYSSILRGLEGAFNGDPASIDGAISQMYSLTETAQEVLAVPSPLAAGTQTGLSFEFVP